MKAANPAFGKTAKASSEATKQDACGNVSRENIADKASDGNGDTRWCAAGEALPQTWQADLGMRLRLGLLRIDWENEAAGYKFRVEISRDGGLDAAGASDGDVEGHASTDRSADARPGTYGSPSRRWPRKTWASIRDVEILSTAKPGMMRRERKPRTTR